MKVMMSCETCLHQGVCKHEDHYAECLGKVREDVAAKDEYKEFKASLACNHHATKGQPFNVR